MSCVLEQRGERQPYSVDLVTAVKSDVLRCDFAVKRQVACCSRRRDAKAVDEVRAANFTEKIKAKVDVGQPFSLGVTQALDALDLHGHNNL